MLTDVRYAFRSLWKNPRFTVIAVLVLALGMGANSAIFSVVYHVLLRPLPYPRAAQLVFLQEVSLRNGDTGSTAPATYADWRDQQHGFSSMAAAELWGATITGAGRAEQLAGLRVSPALLTVLQAAPMLGRGFVPEDETVEAGRVVLLSHALWQRRFGADPATVGRPITLSGASYRVIGVMPPEFHFPPFWAEKTELWVPLVFPPQRLHDRGGRSLRVFGRLKQGVAIEQAASEMSAIARRIELENPATNADRGVRLTPLQEVVVGRVRQTLVVLLGAVAFLLLIACANVANLLLARAHGRQKEIALRLAIGAGRWRLVRQLLVESLMLSSAGGVLGLALAHWSVRALQFSIAEASRFTLPRAQEIGISGVVLLFTFAIASATGILFGLVPALQLSRPNLHAALKEGGRGNADFARGPLRSILIVSEFAISLMLLAGAGLMVRSFARLTHVDTGFDVDRVLTLQVVLTGSPHAPAARRNPFYQQIMARVEALPGVESVSGINHLPLVGDEWNFSFLVEGRPAPKPSDGQSAIFRTVFPGYFRAMGIPLVAGRDIDAHDAADGPQMVIVNQQMARRYWPRENAVGKRIRLGSGERDPWYTVAGVVKDTEQARWGEPARSEFYFSQWQDPAGFQTYLTLIVRAAGDPASIAPAVESAIWSLDRDLPITDVLTLKDVAGRAVWQPRFSTAILGGFAALALLLAAIGIYGVMSYDVSRRTAEVGIRMALGARPSDVLKTFLIAGGKLAAAGTAIGFAGALLLTRYLETMLYEVSPNDPASLAGAAALLGVVALAAVWIPAWRATRIDPMATLR